MDPTHEDMTMRKEHTYTVQKGDSVLPANVGTKVSLIDYTTVAEAIENGHFASEAALVSAAYEQRHIRSNRAVRKILSTTEGTVAQAVAAGNAVKVGEPSARGTPATAKPATVKKNVAASSGNRLFEKCRQDEAFRARMVKQGIVDEAEFGQWLAATTAAEAPAQPTA
jgi:hypothetical protein